MGRNIPARDFAPSKREKSCHANAREIQPAATRHLPLWNMVVTPGTVPEFTIPSLCPARLKGCGREKAGVGSGRRHTIPRSTHPSSLVQTLTRCCPFSEEHDLNLIDDLQTYALSDPTTRAAMSLPHLSKITTPYGFLTLGESPCVCRRESLFFEENGFQEFLRKAKRAPCVTTHGPVKSKNQAYYGNTLRTQACGDPVPLQLQDSCDYSELVRPSHLNYRFLQKGWIKCLRKAPWSR
ncbi:hypothetical protein QQF64_010173 [Cirrhinus molitorella]|uniref:Uncharacterized protein n=2 Tax=Cirrhinus molitorella TaxID=172907 RepID=A0ABR3M397_9TELE|nr:hypothetical protein Q8A67_007664 [Cirrhinus molitorella]